MPLDAIQVAAVHRRLDLRYRSPRKVGADE
jgi:hypothetical protein